MRPGDNRTRLMADIFNKMKAKASEGEVFLPGLINNKSTGKRFAAIAILQEKPNIVDWLAARVGGAEKPL